MAFSKSLNQSLTKGSDVCQDIYWDPCRDVEDDLIQAVGYCNDCSDHLCLTCYSAHKKSKSSRNHHIEDKTSTSVKNPHIKNQKYLTEKCNEHQGEDIRSYCRPCDHLCCTICLNVGHHACTTESLTKAAANIMDSQQLKDIDNRLKLLKQGYNDNIDKAEKHSQNIQKNFEEALKDIRKLRDEMEKLLVETEKQAEQIKEADLKKTESVCTTCSIIKEQINKISSTLDDKKEIGDNQNVFISMKRAESQLKSLEDRLNKLQTENEVRHYIFEPDEKLKTLLSYLDTLGKLTYSTITASSKSMLKTPNFIKDISISTNYIRGAIVFPNQQLLYTDLSTKVSLIDTKHNTLVSQLELPCNIWHIAQVKSNEVAITTYHAKKIQFISVSSNTLTKGREMTVSGKCCGIEYNDKDKTIIVTIIQPPAIEILSMTGNVIKRFVNDANGAKLFHNPDYVALSPDRKMGYVTDRSQNSVTVMTLNDGNIKAVFKDDKLENPEGICVDRSGIVYVVGNTSNTLHQIVPGHEKLELLLDESNGLTKPQTVSYCKVEDKLYVGQRGNNCIQVFKMK